MSTRKQAALDAAQWKKDGHVVGLASGAFDLFHAGHLSFLLGLRGHCSRLIVALTSDATCKAKGASRPVIPEAERLVIVSALGIVDAAFVFSEYGDDANLEAIRPHVFGRGDGHGAVMHEDATLRRLGIETVLIHTPRITSTTEIIARIHDRR